MCSNYIYSKYFDSYDFNTRNKEGQTILHYASQEGLKQVLSEIFTYLKKNKENFLEIINLKDNKSWTCLFSAIDSTDSGLPEIVGKLINKFILYVLLKYLLYLYFIFCFC